MYRKNLVEGLLAAVHEMLQNQEQGRFLGSTAAAIPKQGQQYQQQSQQADDPLTAAPLLNHIAADDVHSAHVGAISRESLQLDSKLFAAPSDTLFSAKEERKEVKRVCP